MKGEIDAGKDVVDWKRSEDELGVHNGCTAHSCQLPSYRHETDQLTPLYLREPESQ
jgi:hypothetical protein